MSYDIFLSSLWAILFKKSREPDENGDGKADGLEFKLEMPLLGSEKVVGAKLLLFFDYTLHVSTLYSGHSSLRL